MNVPWRFTGKLGTLLVLLGGLALIAIALWFDQASAAPKAGVARGVSLTTQGGQSPLCRFGVNLTDDLSEWNAAYLRMGWYVDYDAGSPPAQPNGAQSMGVISLKQVGDDWDYRNLNETGLLQAIAANPGRHWLIGNEPDRRQWQDDLEPDIYARAYHYLYHLIKSTDPTAHVVAGNIVQPTPIRLLYLDMVLNSYGARYTETMPVEIWGIHNFMLPEVSCEWRPADCWGAEVPPGIDLPHGEILTVADNDSFPLFQERIERFRQWMVDRGYGGLPLFLAEFGVLMPEDIIDENGNDFPPARVNAFMNATFDYLLTSTDPVRGDPNDDYRMVQRFSWYSTSDHMLNGALFDPGSQPTEIGANYAAYTSQVSETIDLLAVLVSAVPPVPFTHGENVTVTLQGLIANSGNVSSTQSVAVRFFDGDPAVGGVQIGSDQVTPPLLGCGGNSLAQVTWANLGPEAHRVFLVVDPDGEIAELDEGNNVTDSIVLVAAHRAFLPIVWRGVD